MPFDLRTGARKPVRSGIGIFLVEHIAITGGRLADVSESPLYLPARLRLPCGDLAGVGIRHGKVD